MNDLFQVHPFPRDREIVIDAGYLGARRHIIHALVEFDITVARQFIAAHKQATGESLSLTAFLVASLASAIRQHPLVQAYRNWRSQLIVFNAVDVVVMIETEKDGVAVPHILRAANHKTFRQLHEEIRSVQTGRSASPQTGGLSKLGKYAPRWARLLFFKLLKKNPPWLQRLSGTVVITSVGMFGRGGGWGFGFLPVHTLGLTVGGISERLVLRDGQLESRESLCLTISLDHDIVDGAPAARFANTFRTLVESGAVLNAE